MIWIAIIIIFISSLFSRLAHSRERSKVLWSILGILSFFGSILISAVLVQVFFPDRLNSNTEAMAMAICAGTIGIVITYLYLFYLPDGHIGYRDKFRKDDVLDDNFD